MEKFNYLLRLWRETDGIITPEMVENLIAFKKIVPDDMIIWAAWNGRDDLVNTLLQLGANPNKRGYNDEVPVLVRAAEAYSAGGTFSSVSHLLRCGADPHAIVELYDGNEYYYGTAAVVAFKAFRVNILKAA
jgi:hypothetical protein